MVNKYISKILDRIIRMLHNVNGNGYGTASIQSEVKLVKRVLGQSSPKVLIDVGGNIGLYTDQLLKDFQNVEVHIFEPSLTNTNILSNKFSLNKNVTVNPVGLSNVNETVKLYSDVLGSGLGSLTKRHLDHFNINFDQSETIKVIKFIDYYNTNFKGQTIDLFKIDVEGHEMDVLEGCEEVIDNIKCIQFEFGGCNIDTKTYFQDFWYFLKKRNFDIYRISPIGLISIDRYSEQLEYFRTTNFICVNRNIN
jgi:FkbM family methyltransferase